MRVLRLLLPVAVLLAACGQTGPLVLPEQTLTPPPTAVMAPTPQGESDESPERADDATPADTTAPTDTP